MNVFSPMSTGADELGGGTEVGDIERKIGNIGKKTGWGETERTRSGKGGHEGTPFHSLLSLTLYRRYPQFRPVCMEPEVQRYGFFLLSHSWCGFRPPRPRVYLHVTVRNTWICMFCG